MIWHHWWQAIIWRYDGLVNWFIYTLLSLNRFIMPLIWGFGHLQKSFNCLKYRRHDWRNCQSCTWMKKCWAFFYGRQMYVLHKGVYAIKRCYHMSITWVAYVFHLFRQFHKDESFIVKEMSVKFCFPLDTVYSDIEWQTLRKHAPSVNPPEGTMKEFLKVCLYHEDVMIQENFTLYWSSMRGILIKFCCCLQCWHGIAVK